MPKQRLQVRPLRRAYQPKYPSFSDPNPLDYPETRPYPFSQKMIDALSKAGFAGALLLSPMAVDAQTTDTTTGNPFPLAATNLPYTPISYGTGQPSRLVQEDVVDLIYEVFIQEGLQPARDTVIKENGFSLTANAYDESCKIGFVWLDYFNYGDGMQKAHPYSWNPGEILNHEQQKERSLLRLESEYRSYLSKPDQYIEQLVNPSYRNTDLDRELQADFREQLPTLEGEQQRTYFLSRLASFRVLKEYAKLADIDELSAYADLVQSIIEQIEDPVDRYTYLIRSDQIKRFLNRATGELEEPVETEIRTIAGIKRPKAWQAGFEELLAFTALDARRRYVGRSPEVEKAFHATLTAKTEQEREEKRLALSAMINDREVSLSELQEINRQATEGETYIAPISHWDNRVAYRGSLPMPHTPEVQAKLAAIMKAINESTDEEEQQALQEEYTKIQKQETLSWEERQELAKLEALRQLEEDVRNYIRWARAQQGY